MYSALDRCTILTDETQKDANWCTEWMIFVLDQGSDNFSFEEKRYENFDDQNSNTKPTITDSLILKYNEWEKNFSIIDEIDSDWQEADKSIFMEDAMKNKGAIFSFNKIYQNPIILATYLIQVYEFDTETNAKKFENEMINEATLETGEPKKSQIQDCVIIPTTESNQEFQLCNRGNIIVFSIVQTDTLDSTGFLFTEAILNEMNERNTKTIETSDAKITPSTTVLSLNSITNANGCKTNEICVKKGDFIKAKEYPGDIVTITFGNMIDDEKIEYELKFEKPNGEIEISDGLLDKKIGKVYSEFLDLWVNFSYLRKIPFENNMDFCNEKYWKSKYSFKGESRDTIICEVMEGTGRDIYDYQTGILFEQENIDRESSYILLDTNIIENNLNDSEKESDEKIIQSDTATYEKESTKNNDSGGGCLIATAAYGSELAPQVQQLRELRDNSLLATESGTNFIGTFNEFYYSFSPVIADYERENPVFKEMVKVAITPMITSLSIMTFAEQGSELQVLGLGLAIILLNIGIYIIAPAITICKLKSKRNKKLF